jgi:hypothetical protein
MRVVTWADAGALPFVDAQACTHPSLTLLAMDDRACSAVRYDCVNASTVERRVADALRRDPVGRALHERGHKPVFSHEGRRMQWLKLFAPVYLEGSGPFVLTDADVVWRAPASRLGEYACAGAEYDVAFAHNGARGYPALANAGFIASCDTAAARAFFRRLVRFVGADARTPMREVADALNRRLHTSRDRIAPSEALLNDQHVLNVALLTDRAVRWALFPPSSVSNQCFPAVRPSVAYHAACADPHEKRALLRAQLNASCAPLLA